MPKCQNAVSLVVIFIATVFASHSSAQPATSLLDDRLAEPPVPVSLLEIVWSDLLGIPFDETSNSMFFRPDLPVSVGEDNGYEVMALDIYGNTDEEAMVYEGASFVEHTRYPVYNFTSSVEYIVESGLVFRVSIFLDAISGTLRNADGNARVLAGYVYVVQIDGTGSLAGSGLDFELFMPTDRVMSLEQADARAFEKSYTPPSEIDAVDCVDYTDPCEVAACYCAAEAKIIFDCVTGKCDGFSDPNTVIGIGGAVGLGTAAATGKAAAKKGNLWGTVWGAVGGFVGGAIVSGLTAEAIIDRQCRLNANSLDRKNRNLIRSRLIQCLRGDSPEFECPDLGSCD